MQPIFTRSLLTVALSLSLIFATLPVSSAKDGGDVEVRFSYHEQVERLWLDIPTTPDPIGQDFVKLVDGTQPTCAAAALRKARFAMVEGSIGPAALKALAAVVKVGKEILKAYGIPYVGDAADIITKYLESSSEEEFIEKLGEFAAGKAGEKLGGKFSNDYFTKTGAKEAAKALYKRLTESKSFYSQLTFNDRDYCGLITITLQIKSLPGRPEDLGLQFIASGDCQCKWPTNASQGERLGLWQVIGYAELKPNAPKVNGNTIEVSWTIGRPQYEVIARCGCPSDGPSAGNQPAPTDTESPEPSTTAPKENIVDRICFNQCKELYEEWIKWKVAAERREADAANRELMSDPKTAKGIRESLERLRRYAREAKEAYFRCLENCYKKAVSAGEIAKVPDEVQRELKSLAPKEPELMPTPSRPQDDNGEKKNKKKVSVEQDGPKRTKPEKDKKDEKKTSVGHKVSKWAVVAGAVTEIALGSRRHKREEAHHRSKRKE